jgi:hypothetical protein
MMSDSQFSMLDAQFTMSIPVGVASRPDRLSFESRQDAAPTKLMINICGKPQDATLCLPNPFAET